MDLLVLADRDGIVDMTLDAIARRTNVPDAIVSHAIQELMKPDERSRSHIEDGRRLVLLDSHRDWGWQIINYDHYRDIRDEEARKAYFRNYKRVYRSKDKPEPSESFLANRRRKGQIYYIFHNGLVKIGFSNNPQIRLQDLRVAAPNCILVATEPGTPEKEFERHQQFSSHRKEGEWFVVSADIDAHLESLSPSWKSTPVHTLSKNVQDVLDSPTLSTNAEADTEAEEKAQKTKAKAARGTRLPADFSPDESHEAIAIQRNLSIEGELASFRDYWNGISGQKGTKLDWAGAFRNWLRGSRNGNKNGSKPKTKWIVGDPDNPDDWAAATHPDWEAAQ